MPETIAPRTADEALDALRWALATETPVELRASGTKRGWGHAVEAGALLDLSGLAGIVVYEPEELVLTAAAGTPMEAIEAAVAQRGQMLAFEPPDLGPLWGAAPGGGTLGGAIACNLAGPRRFKAGAARDHTLGIHAVSGRAEVFKAGGRVVKNVTGYDVPKLMAGSFGTLAAMLLVTIKVLPAPTVTRTLSLPGLDAQTATAAMTVALNSPYEVSGAAHLPGGIDGDVARTLIRIEGFPISVAERARALTALLEPFAPVEPLDGEAAILPWRRIRDATAFADADGGLADRALWRVSVAPAAGAAVAARAGAPFLMDWGGGLLWIATDPGDDAGAAVVRAAVAEAGGGHATLVRAPASVRAAVPVFEPQPPALATLTRRVAASFDPKQLLNRGRMRPA
jgi:glycolate oxidase FAD binding subunit